MLNKIAALAWLGLAAGVLPAADYPSAEISNGQIRAKIYLPDAKQGFYRGTRFDWSGVIYSLVYKGHNYYGPWFQKMDPKVRDFEYQGADIVAGPCSATAGPADEFGQLGFETAKAGGNFIKIGVGALRKPDDKRYDNYRLYDVADPGKWTVRKTRESVEFTQQVSEPSSGIGYVYRKTVRLEKGKAEMVLDHSLKNTGASAIHTRVYNHNFLVLDGKPPGPGLSITVPFQIQSARPPNRELAEIRGNQIVYLKTLEGRDTVATPMQGFGDSPKDYEIRIENSGLGAGMRIVGDRPLASESLWSIRATMAVEPFVAVEIEPGGTFTWQARYEYYTVPASGAAGAKGQ